MSEDQYRRAMSAIEEALGAGGMDFSPKAEQSHPAIGYRVRDDGFAPSVGPGKQLPIPHQMGAGAAMPAFGGTVHAQGSYAPMNMEHALRSAKHMKQYGVGYRQEFQYGGLPRGKFTDRVPTGYVPLPADFNDMTIAGGDYWPERVVEIAREVQTPRATVAAPPPADAAPAPRELTIPAQRPAASAPAASAPMPENVSRALWEIYNRTENAADFVRADEAMRAGRAAGGSIWDQIGPYRFVGAAAQPREAQYTPEEIGWAGVAGMKLPRYEEPELPRRDETTPVYTDLAHTRYRPETMPSVQPEAVIMDAMRGVPEAFSPPTRERMASSFMSPGRRLSQVEQVGRAMRGDAPEGSARARISGALETALDISPIGTVSNFVEGVSHLDPAETVMSAMGIVPGGTAAARKSVKNVMDRSHRKLGWAEGGQVYEYAGGGEVEGYGPGGSVIKRALQLAEDIGRLKRPGSGYEPIPGAPATVNIPGIGKVEARPIPELEAAASNYMRSVGRPNEHAIERFVPLNEDFSRQVAEAFEAMRHDPAEPRVRRSFEALADETLAQYRAAKGAGIDIRFLKPGEADTYAASPALGYEDIMNRGRLYVFPTDQGFGSTDGMRATNPLLKGAGRIGDKPDALVNDAFRVVHDLYGHFGPGNPFFRAPGEERAYQLHSRMYSPEARPAAATETRGQNSWVNFGPHAEHNRTALGGDTIYADQKTGLLPDWATELPPEKAEGGAVENEPGLVDRAMAFLSNFNPVGTAEASPASTVLRKVGQQTVRAPQRNAFPGIYGDPREIAAEAARRVAPEDPAMRQLFGVTRGDLYEMGRGRQGNADPNLAFKANPRGSEAAQNVMTPENEQRLIDVMSEARKHEGLRHGMEAWYVMDPAYKMLEEIVGPEEARRYYNRLNVSMGTMSPGTEVPTEIKRGLGANYLQEQGRFDDFVRYGGMADNKRGPSYPADIRHMPGHMYHSTSQAPSLQTFVDTGKLDMKSPKVPSYVMASGVPETGFQTRHAVPDAHFTRAIGMSDTRGGEGSANVSMKMPEYQTLQEWWRDRVAAKMGLEAVPGQALTWGAFSPITGVTSPIGAPKLEMLAKEIMEIAKRKGIGPELARDLVLRGKTYKRGGAVADNAIEVAKQVSQKSAKVKEAA